ncbi:MAG: hypothetical protein LC649_06550 [Bacteroidales bacterium]|nr:hypothetical protein [Bacteroidales bacterium]
MTIFAGFLFSDSERVREQSDAPDFKLRQSEKYTLLQKPGKRGIVREGLSGWIRSEKFNIG